MQATKTFFSFGAILFLLGSFCDLKAQDMPRTVIGSNGDYYDNLLFGSLHFTVGEVAVARYQNGLELGEGFHRAYHDLLVENKEILPLDWAVNVYPNPTTERIRITLPSTAVAEAQLYNQLGQLVHQQTDILSESELDMSQLPAGTYLLRLWDETGRQGTFQVLKVRY